MQGSSWTLLAVLGSNARSLVVQLIPCAYFLKIAPFQAVTGKGNWPTLVKDPKPGKYKPAWRRGVYLGKDSSGHDVIGAGPEEVTRTKALRRTANLWSAEDALPLKTGLGHCWLPTPKQSLLFLLPVLPQLIDKDGSDVQAY